MIFTGSIFEHAKTAIYTIEFEKCGLPHYHILLTLNKEDYIDQIVSGGLSNHQEDPDLYQKVIYSHETWTLWLT